VNSENVAEGDKLQPTKQKCL